MPTKQRPFKQAQILRGTPRNLARLAARLREGELVAVPTETVYGLAADALNPRACRNIFRAKGRPSADPLIVHIHSLEQLSELCESNAPAQRLAQAFWPGPLTLVLPKKSAVPDIVTAGRSSVAVRMPAHRLFRRLLKKVGAPLAAPSANPFGYISPTTAAHVRDGLGQKIRFILDGGPCRIGVESTILDLREPHRPRLLRPGAISRTELEMVLGRPVLSLAAPPREKGAGGQIAPGLLRRHYSPRTPVVLHEKTLPRVLAPSEAALYLRTPARRGKNIFWLDARGDLRGAARRLFAQLRRIDRAGFTRIHAELAPGNDGLAAAINDRLRRAAAR